MSTRSGRSVWYPRSRVRLRVAYFDGSDRSTTTPNLTSKTFEVKARAWSVTFNNHRTPNEFSVTFHERDLPLHPDIVRSATVFIHLASVARSVDQNPGDETDLLLIGTVDKVSENRGDDGQTVTLNGRDETALLLDTKWPRNLKVPTDRSLDVLFRDILRTKVPPKSDLPAGAEAFPAVASFPVVWDGAGVTVGRMTRGTLQGVLRNAAAPGAPSPSKKTRRDTPSAFTEANLWDVLYTLAQHAGAVCEVRCLDGESVIVLRPPETLAPRSDDEFVFLFGRNLEFLEVERELGCGATVPNVEVRCVIDGKFETATWPDPPVVTDWGSDGKPREKRFLPFNVSGFRSREQLRDVAKLLWFQSARKESSFKFATKDLESFNEKDLTKLRDGAPIRLEIDPGDTTYFANLSRQQRADRLLALGYTAEVATEIARAWDLVAERPKSYFLDSLTVSYDGERGVRFEGAAVNYLGDVTSVPRVALPDDFSEGIAA